MITSQLLSCESSHRQYVNKWVLLLVKASGGPDLAPRMQSAEPWTWSDYPGLFSGIWQPFSCSPTSSVHHGPWTRSFQPAHTSILASSILRTISQPHAPLPASSHSSASFSSNILKRAIMFGFLICLWRYSPEPTPTGFWPQHSTEVALIKASNDSVSSNLVVSSWSLSYLTYEQHLTELITLFLSDSEGRCDK